MPRAVCSAPESHTRFEMLGSRNWLCLQDNGRGRCSYGELRVEA